MQIRHHSLSFSAMFGVASISLAILGHGWGALAAIICMGIFTILETI